MTSEVVVMNTSAIAVAADSAITVGPNKVHGNSNKIFLIKDEPPIGLMVFGLADYAGIPWETIAKLFRDRNKGVKSPNVKNVSNQFIDFISSEEFLSSEGSSIMLASFCKSIFEEWCQICENMTKREFSREIRNIVEQYLENFLNRPESASVNLPKLAAFRRKYSKLIFDVARLEFEALGFTFPVKLKGKVTELVYVAMHSNYISAYHSGVVVFGFGEEEIMPSLISVTIDGATDLGPRKISRQNIDITRYDMPCYVGAFADKEMAYTFMEGITPQMKVFLEKHVEKLLLEVAETVVDNNFSVSPDERKTIQKINEESVEAIKQKFMDELESVIYDLSVKEVVEVVRSLPKEDMASLAEALVDVQGLKHKVSPDMESVGGPVDVAIVTKGDGLVWIKRKHYFNLDMNPQFLRRKLNGEGGRYGS